MPSYQTRRNVQSMMKHVYPRPNRRTQAKLRRIRLTRRRVRRSLAFRGGSSSKVGALGAVTSHSPCLNTYSGRPYVFTHTWLPTTAAVRNTRLPFQSSRLGLPRRAMIESPRKINTNSPLCRLGGGGWARVQGPGSRKPT